MMFFTSSFPGLKNLSFSEPSPLKGIFSFFFSKSLMLRSIHFCCHISQCQSRKPPPVLSDLCNNSQMLKTGAGKKIIIKKSDLAKPEGKSCGAKLPPQGLGVTLGAALLCLVSTRAGLGAAARSCRCCRGPASLGRTCCLLRRQTSACLPGAHPRCIPPSLLPSLPCLFHTQILCKVVL